MPQFRERINRAESTEDVKNVFIQCVEKLLKDIFNGKVKVKEGDVRLIPESEPYYQISEHLQTDEPIKSYWKDSDLPHIIFRLAEPAIRRRKHIEKHPEKTEAKIRM
jgi:hypothetical protein